MGRPSALREAAPDRRSQEQSSLVAARHGPLQSLTERKLEVRDQPVTIYPWNAQRRVKAWVRFGLESIRVDAKLVRSTPIAAGIEFKADGQTYLGAGCGATPSRSPTSTRSVRGETYTEALAVGARSITAIRRRNMKKLSTIAQAIADEIAAQDWSDAHTRADGARHNRATDRTTTDQLDPDQTETVKINAMWVVAQALMQHEANFDVHAFAEAAGVADRYRLRSDGSPSGAIPAGLRWN